MNHVRSKLFLATATLAAGLLMSLQTAIHAAPSALPAASRESVGRASFVLPNGWTIANREGAVALVNPGFAETDTLDALIIVGSETLQGADVTRKAKALLKASLPNIGDFLLELQVEADLANAKVKSLKLPELPGAQVTLKGISGGNLPVTVWVGTTRDKTSVASVLVVVLRGKEKLYLPGALNMLKSLEFTALPKDDEGPSASLGGLEFGHSNFFSSGSITTTYSFRADGTVTEHRMTSTTLSSFESEAHGTYEVHGDRVTIRVDGSVENATLVRSQGQITGLRVGNTVFDRL